MTQRVIWVLGGALMVCGASQAFAGALQVARVSAQPGQSVTVPISYQARSGTVATALSTDMHFDKGLANPTCAAGPALDGGADKTVRCAEPSPGVLRLIIFGFNRNPIPSGEVATVTFDVLAKGHHKLRRLGNSPLASDGDGKTFRLARKSGTVTVGAP